MEKFFHFIFLFVEFISTFVANYDKVYSNTQYPIPNTQYPITSTQYLAKLSLNAFSAFSDTIIENKNKELNRHLFNSVYPAISAGLFIYQLLNNQYKPKNKTKNSHDQIIF
ncbi:MAG: hypothetical protein ACYDEC_08570 [Bacteroidia bacterium]